jgi:hypothetical protein
MNLIEPRHGHFSEPVIIDNPPAELNLLHPNHDAYLESLLPRDGRHWRIRARNTIARIEIVESGSGTLIEPIDIVHGVTIAFDVTNLPVGPRAAGTMQVIRNQNDIEFHCVPVPGPGAGFLRWRKVNGGLRTPNRVGLVSESNPDPFEYQITSVTYTTTTGRVTRGRNPQSTSIKITLLAP